MNILIVDDETRARNLLNIMLTDLFKRKSEALNILEADCLEAAVAIIKTKKPDIVFLDIEMPGKSGLQIVDYFKEEPILSKIIFATAYNEYALDAFKVNAIDYLLKPIDIEKLEKSIEKVKSVSIEVLQHKIEELRNTFQQLDSKKIALEVPNGLIFVAPKDIIALVADGAYTRVYLKDRNKIVVSKLLKFFIDQLNEYSVFYKPHRSYYINLKFLKEFSKKEGSTIILDNGMEIPLSRDKKEEFLMLVNQVF